MPSLPSYDAELLKVLQSVSRADVERGPAASFDESTPELETTGAPEATSSPPVSAVVTRVTARTLLAHPETHPVIVDLALLQKYGPEWLEWEPETVQLRAGQDFGTISDLNFSKAMAMKTLHLVDSFWEQWEVFNWCVHPFNSLFPDFEVMQAPTVAQAMAAVDVANRVREDVSWSEEVRLFLGVVHRHEGMFVPQPPVDRLAIIDTTNVDIDLDAVKKAWPSVRVSGKAPSAQTSEAEQLRRMLTAHDFLTESRNRLKAQLCLVQTA